MKRQPLTLNRKSLLLASGLAIAALAGSRQQGQGNVVGYANVPLANGYNFLVNPFNAATNSLNYVLSTAPDGARVYLWDLSNQAFTPPSTFSAATSKWDINYTIPPGTGFVMQVTQSWTNTFIGDVLEGSLTNFVAGTNKYSLLGSKVPFSGALGDTNTLAFRGTDGDNVYTFSTASQSYSDAFTYFRGFGWFDPGQGVNTNGPVINIGQSFFVQNPGRDTNWVKQFTVPHFTVPSSSLLSKSRTTSSTSASPDIRSLATDGKDITLQILNPSGAPYDVQFSADGFSWKTVAAKQTGASWTGPCPGGPQGYYQVTSQ
jgi:hypothetical protein